MVQKATGLEHGATDTAAAARTAQEADLKKANGEYDQFIGSNMTNSPFYKSLVTSGTDATTSAYANAKSNVAARAGAAGFGYGSPAAQGGGAEAGMQEAKAVGQIPVEAVQTAADYGLKAAAGIQGSAGQEGQQSLGYEDAATSLQNTRRTNNAAMMNALIKSASEAGSAGISKWG
jgi:hypothetical protein